jgi:hypothetical protein
LSVPVKKVSYCAPLVEGRQDIQFSIQDTMIHFLEKAQDWIGLADSVALALCVFVFLPMIFIKRARGWGGLGFFYSSFGWGLYLWLTAFLYTYANFGLFWLLLGLLLAGIGVIPIAIIGSFIHRDWSGVLQIVVMLVFSLGFRYFGAHMVAKYEESQPRG